MEGYGSKLSGDLMNYNKYAAANPTTSAVGIAGTPGYNTAQERQMEEGNGMSGITSVAGGGGSGVEELAEGVASCGGGGGSGAGGAGAGGGGGGRRKKKKHKSGEEPAAASTKSSCSAGLADEDLLDGTLPILSDNQDVEDLLFPSTMPPSSGTLVGGQYHLNNNLLDQILTEKKMQLLQSPEVIEFLRQQMAKK